MNPQAKNILAAFVAMSLFWCFAIGSWLAVVHLPGIFDPPSPMYENDEKLTWLGQGKAAVFALGFLLVAIIYIGKRWITPPAWSVPTAVAWYCLGIACSLPYIWFLLVLDWENEFIYRISCWVYDPIAVWAVPTTSFAWDVTGHAPRTLGVYCLRSVIEIALVMPIWLLVWTMYSFFFLGGGWI